MADSSFGIDKEGLKGLLEEIHSGTLGLPEFQRSWVWPQENISSLIASISNGYPVGTLMLLATGGEVNFKTRLVEGSPVTSAATRRLILDGQQRMTSLYQAIRRGKAVNTHDSRNKKMTGWFYVDMAAAVNSPAEREDAITFLPESKIRRDFRNQTLLDLSTQDKEHAERMFPLNQLLDPTEWLLAFIQNSIDPKSATREWKEFLDAFVNPITEYQVPVIEMGAATQREAVVQVFERVNTGGVTLTVFELLTAAFAADEYDLREDWNQRKAQWAHERYRVLHDLANTDFLQAICLLSTYDRRMRARAAGTAEDQLPRIGARRADMLALTLEDYITFAPRIVEGLQKAASFLHEQGVYETKYLPYGSQLIPLSAIFAALGSHADTFHARERIANWYWCGVFGELYGGTTETRFSRDLPDVVSWVLDDTANLPRTMQESQFFSSRLWSLRSRNSAAYKGIYVLLLQRGIRDWLTGETINAQHYFDASIDIHHVFPQDWCDKQGLPKKDYDSILNKTPLAARTNRIIGGNAPSTYIVRLANNADVDKEIILDLISNHLVDPDFLFDDDFYTMLRLREKHYLQLVGAATGKQPQIDTTQETATFSTTDG